MHRAVGSDTLELDPLRTVFLSPSQFHNLQELRRGASLANKVFLQRDYSQGTTCSFQTRFPSELETRVGLSLTQTQMGSGDTAGAC